MRGPYIDTRPAWAFFIFLFGLLLLNTHLDAIEPQTNPGADGLARQQLKLKASTEYVDNALGGLAAELAAGQRVYYCSSATADIGGITYGLLSQSLDSVESSIAVGPITTTTYAQYSPGRGRITPAAGLGVTSIPVGVYDRVAFMANPDTGGRSITIQYRLWRVDAAGTKIGDQIATSTEGVIEALGAGVISRVKVEYPITSAVTVVATDRLMEEFWYKRTGLAGGTDPTITRYIGGTHPGYFSLDLPSGVTMLTDGTNAAAVVALPGALTVAGNIGAGTVQGATQVASSAALTSHTDATTGIHGAPANTRFLTASETIPIANLGLSSTNATITVALLNSLATGTFTIPLAAPDSPLPGMIWFEE